MEEPPPSRSEAISARERRRRTRNSAVVEPVAESVPKMTAWGADAQPGAPPPPPGSVPEPGEQPLPAQRTRRKPRAAGPGEPMELRNPLQPDNTLPIAAEDIVDGPPPDASLQATLQLTRSLSSAPVREAVSIEMPAGTSRAPAPAMLDTTMRSMRPIPSLSSDHDTFKEQYRHFSTFAFNISHGLLAGVALCQLLVSRRLDISDSDFVADYSRVSLGVASMFLVLVSACVVASMARLRQRWADPARRAAWITSSVLVYSLSLLFTVVIASTDVRMDSYNTYSLAWSDGYPTLSTWRVLNVLRFVGCILGWFLLVVDEHILYPQHESFA